MSVRQMARIFSRRLRPDVTAQPDQEPTGPVYRAVTENDVIGCRLCLNNIVIV
jgi:hypothetical protein